MKHGLLLACAVMLGIVIGACARSSKSSQAPAPAAEAAPQPSGAAAPMPDDPKQQIQALEDEIAAARTELKLDERAEGALTGVPAQPMGARPHDADPKCRPAANDTCKTSCTLSDSICGNADKICRIAQVLADVEWAQGKCAKANTTCEASRAKCCGCT